jgi:hypothetical protein
MKLLVGFVNWRALQIKLEPHIAPTVDESSQPKFCRNLSKMQTGDSGKVIIKGEQNVIVLNGYGGNPNVIRRNHLARSLERRVNLRVCESGLLIWTQHFDTR